MTEKSVVIDCPVCGKALNPECVLCNGTGEINPDDIPVDSETGFVDYSPIKKDKNVDVILRYFL